MTDKIRWGVLGNATVARKCVIPAIQKSRNGLLHALATRQPVDAYLVAAESHIKLIYDGYEALLEDPLIDAVYIPLPNHLHLPWTLKALSAGKHVLCEKPIACSAEEAQEMANAVDRGNLLRGYARDSTKAHDQHMPEGLSAWRNALGWVHQCKTIPMGLPSWDLCGNIGRLRA